MKILIVEDEAHMVYALQTYLIGKGYSVRAVSLVDDAIVAIKENPPDLILLDLILPKRDGRDLLRYLRKHSLKVPVIVATNVDDLTVRRECLDLGALEYILKGVLNVHQVEAAIGKHVPK
jgi:two-component system, OmpR family, response regulator BaeR